MSTKQQSSATELRHKGDPNLTEEDNLNRAPILPRCYKSPGCAGNLMAMLEM
jgi:hypothetical protein